MPPSANLSLVLLHRDKRTISCKSPTHSQVFVAYCLCTADTVAMEMILCYYSDYTVVEWQSYYSYYTTE